MNIMEVAKNVGASKFEEQTGFVENWTASLGHTIDENLSISRFIHEQVVRDTRAEVLDLVRSNEIPDHVLQYDEFEEVNGGINYDKAAQWANDNLGKQLKTTSELQEGIRDELKIRRDYAESIHEKAGIAGTIGQFTGSLHGFAIDPVNASTMFLGAGQASRGVIALAKREAVIAGVSEAAIQPFVLSWKHDIGADYSATEAMANIAMATGIGGTIGAVTASIGKLLRKKPVTKDEKVAYEAAEYLQSELKQADPKMDAAEYLGNIERVEGEINTSKPKFMEQSDDIDLDMQFESASKENAEMPTIISHEKDIQGETIINYGRATDEVKKIETQESMIEKIRGCLIGG